MKTKNKKKKFDCVEMKSKGSEYIYKKVKNMTRKEELAFWKEEDKKFKLELEALKKKIA